MIIENEQNNKDITEFLGIPVDGDPYSMRQKLIEKGFKLIPGTERFGVGDLEGLFNGEQVKIIILGNNLGVYRIVVGQKNGYSSSEIIRKFNSLVRQFDAKANYTKRDDPLDTYYISVYEDDEDFDRNVKNQKYQATYYQENSKMKQVNFKILKQMDLDKLRSGDFDKVFSGKYTINIFYENLYNNKQ